MTTTHPYPAGWYRFRYGHELKRGRVVPGRFFGKPLVGFRTESGQAHVFDAHCAHLGAHLGDGKVLGETLQCPFHGWRYDGGGQCTQVPFCKDIPAGARVVSHPVVERAGVVYLWHDPAGRAPWFELPEVPEVVDPAWRRGSVHRRVVRCRVQEPRENAVDVAHGPVLHSRTFPPWPGTKGEIRNWVEDDAAASLGFELVNTFAYRGKPRQTTLEFTLVGPGHLVMRSRLPTESVYVVPNTPVDEQHLVFTMASYVKRSRVPGLDRLVAALAMRHLVLGLYEDYAVFEKKRYLESPLLSGADGPILEMRRWLRQFDPVGGRGSRDEPAADSRAGRARDG